jgi:hypothetical protein
MGETASGLPTETRVCVSQLNSPTGHAPPPPRRPSDNVWHRYRSHSPAEQK